MVTESNCYVEQFIKSQRGHVFKPRPSLQPWKPVTVNKFRLCFRCLCANGDAGFCTECFEACQTKLKKKPAETSMGQKRPNTTHFNRNSNRDIITKL
jgi:hypothetical protein